MMKICSNVTFLSLIILAVFSFLIPNVFAQEQKTYTIYVDPIPTFSQPYASDVMNDAITAWHNQNQNVNFVLVYSSTQPHDFEVQWIRDNTGGAWSGEALLASHVMQVTLGDSFCGKIQTWSPYSRSTLDSIATHELGHLLGLGHSTDANNVMNPNRDDFQYGFRTYQINLHTGDTWEVPLCNKWHASFDYDISSSGSIGMNFYFLPVNEVENYKNSHGTNFRYYNSDGCSGKNAINLHGTCSSIAPTGYLIITSPSLLLVNQFSKVSLNLLDTSNFPQYYIPTIPTIQPQTTCNSGYYLGTDGSCHLIQTQTKPLTCPNNYYLASNNLCYKIILPTLNVESQVNGLTLTLTGSSQAMTYGTHIVNIYYDWGDGQGASGDMPQSHTYSHSGTYYVTATTYDSMDNSRQFATSVTIQPTPIMNTENPFESLTAHAYAIGNGNPRQWFVNIEGFISNQYYNRGNQIEIIITNQNGDQIFDQSFLTTNQISQSIDMRYWQDGIYNMKAKYGAYESTEISFVKSDISNQNSPSSPFVSPNTTIVQGTNYSVQNGITNGKVLDITADVQSKSLIVSIQTTGDGVLTIALPRGLIDAQANGQDDHFYVLNDGQGSDFQETSKTTTDRTLSIPFIDGTKQIEIIGTLINGENYNPPSSSSMPSVLQPSSKFTISVNQNTGFDPSTISIPVGSIVTWSNDDNSIHNIQFLTPNPAFDGETYSIYLDQNKKTSSYTFTQSGTYNYYDEIHPSMNGTIIVGSNYVPFTTSSSTIIQSSHTTGFVKADNDQYTLPSVQGDTLSIKISGHLDNLSSGQVKIAWSGENSTESSVFADVSSNGNFVHTITLDSNAPSGKYHVVTYYGKGSETDDQNSIVDKTSFTVISPNQSDNNQDKNKGKTCFLFWCW